MIAKKIEEITKGDLLSLIENKVTEKKSLDYKRSLPGNADSEKKEFLADITSFANAIGGDLIFGITENKTTGEPEKLEGIDIPNVDQLISRFDSMIRDGVEPRIPDYHIKTVDLSNGKKAIILRVAKSWISPHRVVFGGHDKFYSRSLNGKYPLDVGELRIAFLLTETIVDKMKSFRQSRLSALIANDTPVPFNDNPKTVLHIIPFSAFKPSQQYQIESIAENPDLLKPIQSRGWNNRYNFEGFLLYSGLHSGQKCSSYAQLYKNGIIEAVNGTMIEEQIFISILEEELIKSLNNYLALLENIKVDLPVVAFITLLGVKGRRLSVGSRHIHQPDTIDKEILMLPEIVIESYDSKSDAALKPCFDALWNACGYPRSLTYDNSGRWIGYQR